jgi:hypothetical protein
LSNSYTCNTKYVIVQNIYCIPFNIKRKRHSGAGTAYPSGAPESSAVDLRFELRSGQTKNYETGICCFSVNHASLTWWVKAKNCLLGVATFYNVLSSSSNHDPCKSWLIVV